jgi:hypothetical protein
VAEGGDEFLKLRPVGGRAGDLFTEHLFASGGPELSKLAREVLGVSSGSTLLSGELP